MTSKISLGQVRQQALDMLKQQLPANLDYHNFEHTLDVLKAAEQIAKSENINDDDLEILRTAAVLHDSGYIHKRAGHEEESCNIAEQLLSSNGAEREDIEKVKDLIRATKVPQQPHNKLAQILCDADLDYLGREDFFKIAHNVYLEFRQHGIVKDEHEWNILQIRFLEEHKYFTPTAINSRQQKKMEHVRKLKEMVGLEQ
jgi:uncharacterized protein